ncbi:MAG TPA: hypothetical protein VGF75_00165 [Candidatus Saccharimonadales bacterium]|jgi:hypothetical protein
MSVHVPFSHEHPSDESPDYGALEWEGVALKHVQLAAETLDLESKLYVTKRALLSCKNTIDNNGRPWQHTAKKITAVAKSSIDEVRARDISNDIAVARRWVINYLDVINCAEEQLGIYPVTELPYDLLPDERPE